MKLKVSKVFCVGNEPGEKQKADKATPRLHIDFVSYTTGSGESTETGG